MKQHRFILKPYKGMSTRNPCPACNTRGKFSRYIDIETGLELADHVGKCERIDNCGYHFKPTDYFNEESAVPKIFSKSVTENSAPHVPHSVIDKNMFQATLREYNTNIFTQWLGKIIGFQKTDDLIAKYFIGTASHGRVVFWQLDSNSKVRTGKIMTYQQDGHRNKQYPPTWAHSQKRDGKLLFPDFNLRQCLFGEHLAARDTQSVVAICESEKTAIIASAYLPQFIWMACGSKNGVSVEKLQRLKGRSIVLWPDLNGYTDWSRKAKEIATLLPGTSIKVSDLLERKASDEERIQGLDLADYLIRFSPDDFANTKGKPDIYHHQRQLIALFDELNNLIPDGEPIMILGESIPCFRSECRRIIDGFQSDVGTGKEGRWKPYFEEIYKILGYAPTGSKMN